MSDDFTKQIILQGQIEEKNNLLVETSNSHALQAKQAESLDLLAKSVNQIAQFLSGGGLTELLSGYARSQAVKEILGGLATHDGRAALDARFLGQNAIDIVTQVEKVFEKYQQKLTDSNIDPQIKDAEADYKKFTSKKDGV
jgi:hypothetical protein